MATEKIFDDKNNSIATIIRKIKLSDNLYQFIYDKSIIGYYDYDRSVFVSKGGREYFNINKSNTDTINDCYLGTYLVKEDLNLVFAYDQDVSDRYLIKSYTDYMKSVMYLVKFKEKEDGYQLLIKDININKVEDAFNYSDYDSLNDGFFIEESMWDPKRIEKFLDEDIIDKLSISRDINKLVMDIYNCEYNSSELFSIANNINSFMDYFQQTLDTIELQLHAYYNRDKEPLHPDSSDDEFLSSNYDPYKDLFEYKEKDKNNDNYKIKEKLDLIKLRDEIKKHLLNQDEALRRVLVEIARMDVKDNEQNKGILLLGESGTGKTFLMELLAKNLGVPFLVVDSTQLTIPGYVGKDIQEYLWDLYIDCGRDIEKTENAIIFFDEIDKKGSNRKNDSSGQGVLNVLLKFLDGTSYDACEDVKKRYEVVKINTSKMKVIAGGAFSDVFKKNNHSSTLGFIVDDSKKDENGIPDVDTFVQKAMMTPEFMGRFPIRIKLNSHSIESFSRILEESESSTLKEEQRAFKRLGVDLKVTPKYIELASSKALELKTGVRGLMGTIEESTWVAFEDVYNHPNKYKEILLTDETLKDPNNYQKVLKKPV